MKRFRQMRPCAGKWVRLRYLGEGILAACALNELFYRSWFAFLPLAPVPFLWARVRLRAREKKEKKELLSSFRTALASLIVSVRAGYSAENAFFEAEEDLRASIGDSHPMTCAFAAMNRKLCLHESTENVLTEFAEESGLEEVRDFAEVFRTAKRMGGNMAEILSGAARLIGDRIRVESEIEAAVAAKKFEQRIMSVMPFGILLYMRLASPGFLDALYGNPLGAAVMTVCLAVYAAAFFLGKRIVDIRV